MKKRYEVATLFQEWSTIEAASKRAVEQGLYCQDVGPNLIRARLMSHLNGMVASDSINGEMKRVFRRIGDGGVYEYFVLQKERDGNTSLPSDEDYANPSESAGLRD